MDTTAPSITTAQQLQAALDEAQHTIERELDRLQFTLPDGFAVSSVTIDVLNPGTVAGYLDARFAVAINVEVKA